MWSSRNRMLMDTDGDDVAFLSGSGDSRHGLYGNAHKRDLYERGHVAVCSRGQAIALTIFVFSAIFLTALSVAFIRPFSVGGAYGARSYLDHCLDERLAVGDSKSGKSHDNNGGHHPKTSPSWDDGEPIATNGEPFPWNNIRLPTFIHPVRYDVELTPNLTTLWVKGIEKLIFTVSEETQFIVFHSHNITITSRTINERLKVERILEFPERQQVYLETDEVMIPGITYAIRIKFEYKLNNILSGFYLSKYVGKDGKERRLATTNFEPTYARWAFPCFDEPHLKAKFLMTITHDKDTIALFNTPKKPDTGEEVRGKPNQIRDEFEESVEMSTYLVAFVVCDFASVSRITHNNINVSVIAAKDKINQADFALEAATRLMDHYTEFFKIPYPLPKQDLIAIPDFASGAMENWGLITYRETSLLYSEEETSVEGKQWIAIVVAHELAHQWFGNLVTMAWWNDLWLNEGFATWMEYQGVDYIQPDWKMSDHFMVDIMVPALELDSLTTSHPVSVEVKDPGEIRALFDLISYKKGAAIIHMLESTVGEDVLRDGLTRYLNKHKFQNAVTDDLWDSVSEAWLEAKERKRNYNRYNGSKPNTLEPSYEAISMVSSSHGGVIEYNFTVKELMDAWTLQSGYPLVSFVQQNDTNIYTIEQTRFLTAMNINNSIVAERIKAQENPIDKSHSKWIIPLNYFSNLDDFQDTFVINKTHNIEVEFPADMKWFKANRNGTGFYRVNYPKENWDALVKALVDDHNVFSPSDRVQLLSDAFSLSRAGLINATIPLEMAMYLKKEEEVAPWKTALSHLRHWKKILQDTNLVPLLDSFIQHLVTPHYKRLDWKDVGEHKERLLRNLILSAAVETDTEDAVTKALILYNSLVKGAKEVSPNFRRIVYKAGVRHGTTEDFKFAWKMYNSTLVASERNLWIGAMGSSSNPYNLQQYLDTAINTDKIKAQDVAGIFETISSNPAGSQIAWRELRMSWKSLLTKFGEGSMFLGTVIKSTISHFSTEFDYQSVQSFFRKKRSDVSGGIRDLDQGIEQIIINIQWRESNENTIRKWIHQRMGKGPDKELLKKKLLMS